MTDSTADLERRIRLLKEERELLTGNMKLRAQYESTSIAVKVKVKDKYTSLRETLDNQLDNIKDLHYNNEPCKHSFVETNELACISAGRFADSLVNKYKNESDFLTKAIYMEYMQKASNYLCPKSACNKHSPNNSIVHKISLLN